jgi:hypothetical protein
MCTLKCVELQHVLETVFTNESKKLKYNNIYLYIFVILFILHVNQQEKLCFYPNPLSNSLVSSVSSRKIKIYYYNFACVIYIDINNPLFFPFISPLLPFLPSSWFYSLNTLYIHQQKEKNSYNHNSIKLINIHQGGQRPTRMQFIALCIHICRYICIHFCCSLFRRYHYICPYKEILIVLFSYRKTTDVPK